MKIKITYEEGYRFSVQSGMHQITVDQPKEKGGSDSGMNPLEIFLSSLGSCIAFYITRYCQDTKIDPKGFTVDIESELSQERPLRFKEIKVKINLNQDLGSKKESFLKFIKNCPVHNTITGQPNVVIEL
ncbi:MAG: OsmC family protein [Candidatus Omnitrophica bacterium]|nr:OsmC family protein [Candidatus Omnitrophota bacterium]MDD5352128.1 OsmC family protein [Candidatus Omnitrophota bacterium]MDD5549726.1 OsmC family protein [Candidatus Omnitrophota bacterium]